MKYAVVLSTLAVIVISSILFFQKPTTPEKIAETPIPSPTPEQKVKVKYPQDFVLVLVGDSMTESMGNSDELRKFLGEYYPGKSFEVLNYGFGSTNILSLQERLTQKTFFGREFRPITEIDFDLILIESFGYNPLSENPLEEGLRKQNEALRKAVDTIKSENPKAKILFVATIAPSRIHFGRGSVELSSEKRRQWAIEREEYIKNHIKFAEDNGIPVVNIFEASKPKNEEANLDYIRNTDYIHPSPQGVIFISKEIADFIFENKIL